MPVLVRVLLCVVPVAGCPPRFRLGVGCVWSPVLVRVLVFVVPALTVVAYLLNIRISGPVAPLNGQYSRGGLN